MTMSSGPMLELVGFWNLSQTVLLHWDVKIPQIIAFYRLFLFSFPCHETYRSNFMTYFLTNVLNITRDMNQGLNITLCSHEESPGSQGGEYEWLCRCYCHRMRLRCALHRTWPGWFRAQISAHQKLPVDFRVNIDSFCEFFESNWARCVTRSHQHWTISKKMQLMLQCIWYVFPFHDTFFD